MGDALKVQPLASASATVIESDKNQQNINENAWIRLMTVLHWYPKDMPAVEKKLVLKLDLMILIYGCLCFFTKYLDQASLTNAYVT
jgi:ACS family pantothenate transporter-like MFS transporter